MWVCNFNTASAQSTNSDKVVVQDQTTNPDQVVIIKDDNTSGVLLTKDGKDVNSVARDDAGNQQTQAEVTPKNKVDAFKTSDQFQEKMSSKPATHYFITGNQTAANAPIPVSLADNLKVWVPQFIAWYNTLGTPSLYLNAEELAMYKNGDWQNLYIYESPTKK